MYEVPGIITHAAINHTSAISQVGNTDVEGKPAGTFPLSIPRQVSCKYMAQTAFSRALENLLPDLNQSPGGGTGF